MILLHIHRLPIDASLIYPIVAPWILFGMGVALFITVAKLANWSAQTTGGLILSASLANTSFLGLPMIETFYGVSFLRVGILIDQLGTDMVLSTLGIIVAVIYSSSYSKAYRGEHYSKGCEVCSFPGGGACSLVATN